RAARDHGDAGDLGRLEAPLRRRRVPHGLDDRHVDDLARDDLRRVREGIDRHEERRTERRGLEEEAGDVVAKSALAIGDRRALDVEVHRPGRRAAHGLDLHRGRIERAGVATSAGVITPARVVAATAVVAAAAVTAAAVVTAAAIIAAAGVLAAAVHARPGV